MHATICDYCGKALAESYDVYTGRQFSGSCGTDPVFERIDLCDKHAAAALAVLLKKWYKEGDTEAGKSILAFRKAPSATG